MSLEIYILLGFIALLAVLMVTQQLRLDRLKHRLAELSGKPKPIVIDEPSKADLEAQLKAAYEAKIKEGTQAFGEHLNETSTTLSELVTRLTTEVIEQELDAYHKTLDGVRQSANEAMEQIRDAVEQQRVELRKGMEADVAAERGRLIDRFDAKLGDVVSSYIAESLGGGVDLGAQLQYIVTSLEAHKDEIRKDLTNGV